MKTIQRCVLIALWCFAAPVLSSAATATLTWQDNSANETGFAVERRTDTPAGPWNEVGRVGANVVTFQNTLAPGDSVCYRVFAFNTAGKSGNSNEACTTVPPLVTVPNAPSGLGATMP